MIPLAKDFKEAVILRQPVGHYRPRSVAAKVIAGLADELWGGSRRGSARGREEGCLMNGSRRTMRRVGTGWPR